MRHRSWNRSFGGAGPHQILCGERGPTYRLVLPFHGRRSSMEEHPVVDGMVGGSIPLGDPSTMPAHRALGNRKPERCAPSSGRGVPRGGVATEPCGNMARVVTDSPRRPRYELPKTKTQKVACLPAGVPKPVNLESAHRQFQTALSGQNQKRRQHEIRGNEEGHGVPPRAKQDSPAK